MRTRTLANKVGRLEALRAVRKDPANPMLDLLPIASVVGGFDAPNGSVDPSAERGDGVGGQAAEHIV